MVASPVVSIAPSVRLITHEAGTRDGVSRHRQLCTTGGWVSLGKNYVPQKGLDGDKLAFWGSRPPPTTFPKFGCQTWGRLWGGGGKGMQLVSGPDPKEQVKPWTLAWPCI